MPKKKSGYDIVNIVATTDIGQKLDLDKINLNLKNVKYDPKIYFALIYQLISPKLSILVNSNGKIIFTGAKHLDDVENARNRFFKDLKALGYRPQEKKIRIVNFVLKINIGEQINLNKIFESNQHLNLDYEPEQFPAIIFKNKNPRFTALIFQSGNLIITGCKDLDSVYEYKFLIRKLIDNSQENDLM